MQINVSLSGTVRFVHEVPQGTSPLATLDDLKAMESRIVSALSDAIAAASTSADSAISRVQADVTSLKAQIAALQAQIDAGGGTPADMQALADLKTKLDALDPTSPVVLPPTP